MNAARVAGAACGWLKFTRTTRVVQVDVPGMMKPMPSASEGA